MQRKPSTQKLSRRASVGMNVEHVDHNVQPTRANRPKVVDEYATNRYTLSFKNPETEQRYCYFSYIHSGFYGGKLWHLVSIGAFSFFFLVFHPLGITNLWRMMSDSRFILIDITVISSIMTFLCMFFEKLYPYREHLLLVSFASHWPALATLVTIGKEPAEMSYAVCLTCYFFCAFISQVRFCRLFPFLTITPLLTLIILVTTQTSYFETHAITEIAFWPSVFFPIMLLRAFETRNRKSFETVERSERRVEELGLKVQMAQLTVANFFPPTPTVDLLVPPKNPQLFDQLAGSSHSSSQSTGSRRMAWSSSEVSTRSHRHRTSLRYTDCAMIVTDLAGFTQWTASCAHDPTIVIALLTKMFLNIDNIMPLYKVEKIATVGDAFIGVIFNDCPGDAAKVGLRASHAMQFGCDILHTASSAATGSEHSLRMRVGIHVGNFVGGFVGTTPPKFDLFGADYEVAKVMESSGRPEHVHASHEAVVAAMVWEKTHGSGVPFEFKNDELVAQFCSRHSSYETTPTGVLMPHWEWPAPPQPTIDDASPTDSSPLIDVSPAMDDLNDSNDLDRFNEIIEHSAIGICERLIKIRHGDLYDDDVSEQEMSRSLSAGSESHKTLPHQVAKSDSKYTINVKDDESGVIGGVSAVAENVDEDTNDDLKFHPLFLEFYNKSTEKHYQTQLLSSDLITKTFTIMGMLQFLLLFFHALNTCQDTVWNRLIFSGCLALTTIWFAFVNMVGVKTQKAMAFVLCCMFCTFLLPMFQTTDCGHRGVLLHTGDAIVCYFVTVCVGSQFAFMFRMKYRFLLLNVVIGAGYVFIPIRMAAIGDDGILSYDGNLVLFGSGIATYAGMSFFVDFSQRAAYASSRKLHRLLVSAKGKAADTATQAMDIMLPSFVSEALAQGGSNNTNTQSDDDDDDGSHSESSRLTGGASSNGSSKVIDLEVMRDGMVWEYPTVVVMFIKFTPLAPSSPMSPQQQQKDREEFTDLNLIEDYDEINGIIGRLEQVIAKHEVQKVKTIGNCLLAVVGIDADCTEPFRKMFTAALEAKELLSQRSDFTIGISSGACFGAVIGVKGLCFDIFGDTVNTASRMCTTAAKSSIQMTDATRMTALATDQLPSGSTVEHVEKPVMVKGKGAMEVYRLVPGER